MDAVLRDERGHAVNRLERLGRWIALGAVALVCCVTTPVPVPPTVVDIDLGKVDIEDEIDAPFVLIAGGPGSIDPPDTLIRITNAEAEDPPDAFVEFVPDADGSFSTSVPGMSASRYFVEAITEDDDVFLMAFANGPTGVVAADPGPDSDDDGSPDAIDCAPEDDAYRGRRCP